MNIPLHPSEQIKRVYNRAYDEGFVTSGGGQHVLIEAGVLAVAEWARREALREAADAVRENAGEEDENGICAGVSNWPDASARTYSFAAHEAIEAIRALAGGAS